MRHASGTGTAAGGMDAQTHPTGGPADAANRSAQGEGMGPRERRLLAAMPLHAITALHGESGLRERLTIETAAFRAADRECIAQALDLASRLHAADRRQNEPYVNHLLRVAIRIITYYRVRDADVICTRCCMTRSKTTPTTSPPAASPKRSWRSPTFLLTWSRNWSNPLPTPTMSRDVTGMNSTASTSPPA